MSHDIAGIWVAFFSGCQRYRCRQDGRLYTSDNPLRLADGSLLVQVAVCLGDRKLGWGGSCGINGSSGPCQAPTQVIYRSVDEGAVWSFQGVLSNPADYPEVTDMKEPFHCC